MNRNTVVANTFVAVFGLFFAFMAVVWPLPQGIFMWALALLPFLAVLYWRFKVYPVSGFLLIKHVSIWVSVCLIAGIMLSAVVGLVDVKVFGGSLNHGFAVVLLFYGALLGIVSGVIVGYRRYRRVFIFKK